MMRTYAAVAGLLVAFAACSRASTPPTAPTTAALADALTGITNPNPTPGATPQAAQTITFTATAGYTLGSVVGVVDMTVRDQDDHYLVSTKNTLSEPFVIRSGSGNVAGSHTVTLPGGTTTVRVVFTLSPHGVPPTTSLEVSYPVL
jgi:hypothetical protein